MPDSSILRVLWLTVVLLLPAGHAAAAQPTDVQCCQGISAAELARATAIMERQYLYDCCDDTVATCLREQAQACPLAGRLAGEICRRVGAGQDDAAIDQALRLRARSMLPSGSKPAMDLEGAPSVGDAAAPVLLVEYACLRCPFCARMTPQLEEDIQSGALKGKVRLVYRLFPIKGHEGSTESGLAALAAHSQGKFWEYLNLAYERFDSFSVDKLRPWAQELGLDMAAYDAAVADPAVRQRLVDSKREGMAAGVNATPTLFIDGRMYHGELDRVQLLDVLEEEYERVTAAAR